MFRFLIVVILCFGLASQALAEEPADLQLESVREGAVISLDRLVEDGKLIISVSDTENKPLLGLLPEDFKIMQHGKQAKILSVESYSENLDVPRNIVLVLDNSDSMRQRKAVAPLLSALDELLKIVRPIDQVSIIVFDDRNTERFGNFDLNVRTFRSNQPVELKNFVNEVYSGGLTSNTVLYEGMLAGLEMIRDMPAEEPKFMVVFSDGQDLNSDYKAEEVEKVAAELKGFDAYAIDYMPGNATDPFLNEFSRRQQGEIWKATAETNLVPIFQAVASKLQYHYVVNYQFPVEGSLAVEPNMLTIEEIRTIDASPMLGQVFFAPGSGSIDERYVRFSDQADTRSFDESRLRGTLEKYYQVLNIIGKRLTDHPEATITLVGCNANVGEEKGNTTLSAQRAEAVKAYLQYLWNIAPDRMQVEARNLPEKPSTSRNEQGQADNRRVEIRSESPALTDLVRSTYISHRFDRQSLLLHPVAESAYGIADWRVVILSGSESVGARAGEGAPPAQIVVPLQFEDVAKIAGQGALQVAMTLEDNRGQILEVSAPPVTIDFIQTRERLAQKLDVTVQEKYALILFDFDSAAIDAGNQAIVDQIVGRVRELPQATVTIVGHSDNIGKEEYNIKLSERRAKAVYDLLMASYGEEAGERISYSGVGPNDPPFDNETPEGRAFNRTVTITLEYLAQE